VLKREISTSKTAAEARPKLEVPNIMTFMDFSLRSSTEEGGSYQWRCTLLLQRLCCLALLALPPAKMVSEQL
jgi:hypothetical protein